MEKPHLETAPHGLRLISYPKSKEGLLKNGVVHG